MAPAYLDPLAAQQAAAKPKKPPKKKAKVRGLAWRQTDFGESICPHNINQHIHSFDGCPLEAGTAIVNAAIVRLLLNQVSSISCHQSDDMLSVPQVDPQQPLVYRKPEDEFFHRHCAWSFTFQGTKEAPSNELQPMRVAMLVRAAAPTTPRPLPAVHAFLG